MRLFVGKNPYIRNIINGIKKNYKNKNDYFEDIHPGKIDKLYDYDLYGKETDDMNEKAEFIIDQMYLDKSNDIQFINDIINEDDTVETVNKIIKNCYDDVDDITYQYLYAYFYDINYKKVSSSWIQLFR